MKRAGMCVLAACWLIHLAGCQSTAEQRDTQFRLRQCQREKDELRQRYAGEQAKALALQKRMEAEQEKWHLSRAQVANLQSRVHKLTAHIERLEDIVAAKKAAPLERPDIRVSPLPEPIDQALLDYAGEFSDRVWYARERGAITFANDRLFGSGSDELRADAIAGLNELADVFKRPELSDHEIVVVGHTDAAPITKPETLAQHPTNWHLSVHRAIAVKDVLEKAGVPTDRLGVMGYAQYRPASPVDPARNRRVELFIVPEGAVGNFEPIVSQSTR